MIKKKHETPTIIVMYKKKTEREKQLYDGKCFKSVKWENCEKRDRKKRTTNTEE